MRLTFRETGLKKETKQRILILVLTFMVSLIFFTILLNYKPAEKTIEVAKPTLPTVTLQADGADANELHGYTSKMDALYMRDAVIPINDAHELPLTIHTFGKKVTKISYEIRSTDTSRKISDKTLKSFSKKGNSITATLKLGNLIEKGEEYLFVLDVYANGENIYYYTRVQIPTGGAHTKDCMAFAKQFHENALSGNEEAVSAYIEPSADTGADTTTLSNVTLTSQASQVCWNGFKGKVTGTPRFEYKEFNDNYTSIVVYYQMERKNSAGQAVYYNVEEYFKIRYTANRMYLLDYERTMNEMLTAGSVHVSDNVLNTGVHSGDMTYLSNETGTIVSFVQAGELFEYNQNTRKLSRIFSFSGDNVTDSRAISSDHNILLMNIDESGTMDFVVYGYMNTGIHEGKCGIELFHYDSTTNRVKEQAFVQTTNSYQILNANFSNLLYESTNNHFYIMVDGTLVDINLKTLQTRELLKELSQTQYASSKSGRYIAWISGKQAASKIKVMDLEKQTTFYVKAPDKDLVRPLAFLDEDLIYGEVHKTDVTTDAAGGKVYPMYHLAIMRVSDAGHKIVENYEKPGIYVTDMTLEDYTLQLTRVTKQADGSYAETVADSIKNSSKETNKTVQVAKAETEGDGETLTLTMAALGSDESIKRISFATTEMVMKDLSKVISVQASKSEKRYFVYVGSRVVYAGSDVSEAIQKADEQMGIVVDNTQQYIWKKGRSTYKNAITSLSAGAADNSESSQAKCLSAILNHERENVEVHTMLSQGMKPVTILSNALKNATVIDLTGCTLDETLYYVAQGNPVYAVNSAKEAVLITGYDASSITIWNPKTEAFEKEGMTEATNDFTAAGNIFISYVK